MFKVVKSTFLFNFIISTYKLINYYSSLHNLHNTYILTHPLNLLSKTITCISLRLRIVENAITYTTIIALKQLRVLCLSYRLLVTFTLPIAKK